MLSGIEPKQHLQDMGVSYNTPILLMLSGIGPKQHLQDMGVSYNSYKLLCFRALGRGNTYRTLG